MDVADVRSLDFEAFQPVDWDYIYGLGHIPDSGAADFIDENAHHFTVHQEFAGGHSVDFVFSGKGLKYLGPFPVSGTIKHLQIKVDGNDAYDFSHFHTGVASAFKLFEKPPATIVKTLFSGHNWITGSPFADTLSGFKGDDRFTFKYVPTGTNVDTILDFRHNRDVIYFDNSFFDVLGDHGHLKGKMFIDGPAALTPNQHILYNQAAGEVKFDPDGSGPLNPIPVAILNNHPSNFAAHDILLG